MSSWEVHLGDCLDVISSIPDNSLDSIVTDPPYGLSKPPDIHAVLKAWMADEDYRHKAAGFMNQKWDAFVPGPRIWKECLRVLKPGGHLMTFFGTRTFDIGSLAVRLAGFEIRDTVMWVYGSGFTKSVDVAKALEKESKRRLAKGETEAQPALLAAAEQWGGWGTALKPAIEPILLARKPLEGRVIDNLMKHGCGGLNVDACRVEPTGESRPRINEATQDTRYTNRGATNFAAKPGVRGGHPSGRFPANLIHDGSEETLSFFPEAPGALVPTPSSDGSPRTTSVYGNYRRDDGSMIPRGDQGSAARFFYCAKANRRDRNEGLEEGVTNRHTTVKPTNLMRYLCRLVTPSGGVVFDPFMGSGSTGKAALLEGFRFIGIEQDPEFVEVARQRLEHAVKKAAA